MEQLSEFEKARICEAATKTVADMIRLLGPKAQEKTGCCLALMSRMTGKILLRERICEPPEEKWLKYYHLAPEKGEWLFKHPGCISSWEGKGMADGKPGGAIVTSEVIPSMSGLTETMDEAGTLILSIRMGWLTYRTDTAHIKRIIAISGNHDFSGLEPTMCFSELYEVLNC